MKWKKVFDIRYASIRDLDISNGEGTGVSLFVQGCPFRCKNCFNKDTWDFNGGKEWTKEVKDKFLELIDRPYIKRISILGGEPLADKHIREIYLLTKEIKSLFPNKKIWLYSGFTYDEIMNRNLEAFIGGTQADDYRQFILNENVDVFVDGRYVDELRDTTLKFRGSSNQNIWKKVNDTWIKTT